MLKDLVIRNRSYRGYDASRRVTREELLEFVDLTRYTASSVNLQPLKYYAAWEEAEVAEIQRLTGWAAALPALNLPYPGTEPAGFVAICLDTGLCGGETAFLRDVGIAAQTMLLAAVEKGLGGCMIGNFSREKLKALLHLPDAIEPNLLVAFGKPAETVVLTGVGADGSTRYFRDASGTVHYVPKRALQDILLSKDSE